MMSHAVRKWELFPGKNRFCLNGRIIMGPDINVFYINIFLIVTTTLIFLIFDCPYLTINVSPIIPVITLILFIFVMSSLLRTSFSDPGIIPRATQDEAIYIEKQIKMQNCGDAQTDRPPPRTKEVIIRGQSVKLKYCFTCRIFRPPRASHCSLCDNCVEHFDHHCPWVGNCVGRRNYRYFYLFTVSLSIYIAFVFICTCTHLYFLSENRFLLEAISDSPGSVIVLLVTFFSCWNVFGLAGFHTYLAASNETTNEDIKGSFTGRRGGLNRNPYSFGNACSNCCNVLCGPVPSSLIDRRGFINPNYLSERNLHEKHVIKKDSDMIYSNKISDNYNSSPLQTYKNGVKIVSSDCQQRSNNGCQLNALQPSVANQFFYRSQSSVNGVSNICNSVRSNNKFDPAIIYETVDESISEERNKFQNPNPPLPAIDVSAIDLDLDDVVKPSGRANQENSSVVLTVPLSASRLQLLQDTTMIESALDLDSLEESTSSFGANSHAGLIKKMEETV